MSLYQTRGLNISTNYFSIHPEIMSIGHKFKISFSRVGRNAAGEKLFQRFSQTNIFLESYGTCPPFSENT